VTTADQVLEGHLADTAPAPRRPRVVVIGGGFAGLSAVRQLSVADADVTLVDRHAYNTFQPLLYQVATAGLDAENVSYSIRGALRGHRRRRPSNVRPLVRCCRGE